jgi:hypothetical protein
LTFLEKLVYNIRMARPPKNGVMRMDRDIRIPITGEQKALIVQATSDEPEGMAAWARAVLIREARKKIARLSDRKTNQH